MMEAFFEKYQVLLKEDVKKLFEAEYITDNEFYKLGTDRICQILKQDLSLISLFLPIFAKEKNNLDSLICLTNDESISSMEIVISDEVIPTVESSNNSSEIINEHETIEEMNVSQNTESDDDDFPIVEKESPERYLHDVPDNFSFIENELYFFLSETLDGRIILGMYKYEKILLQTRLKHLIILKLINENPIHYNVTARRLEELGNQVVALFPTVKKRDWYRPPDVNVFGVPVSAGGCLVNYYKVTSTDLRKAHIKTPKEKNVLANVENTVQNFSVPDIAPLTDPDRSKYLINSVTEAWDKSFKHRQETLINKKNKKITINYSTYLNTFICLKSSITLELLESDCARIVSNLAEEKLISSDTATNFSTIFCTRWLQLSETICVIAKASGSHDIKEFRKRITNLENVPPSILALFYLPYFLTKALTVKTKGSVTFLREEISDHFIKVIENESLLNPYKTKFEAKLSAIDHKIHPYLVFCGKLDAISKAFIVLNGKNYEIADPLKAVDVYFKVSVALHTWSLICSPIWCYLQEHVYGIPQNISCALPLLKQFSLISNFIKKVDDMKLKQRQN